MPTGQQLDELYVLFTVKDAQKLLDAFQQTTKALTPVRDAIKELGTNTEYVFKRASLFVGGFVTAGIAASNMGQVFGYQMAELSRQVASLFLPEILKVNEALQSTLDWFRRLTGSQQEQIAHWLKIGLVVGGSVYFLPKLIAGWEAVGKAIKAAGVVFNAAFLSNPLVAVVSLLGLAVISTMDWKDVTDLMKFSFETLKTIIEAIKEPIHDILELFREIGRYIREAVSALQSFGIGTNKAKDDAEAQAGYWEVAKAASVKLGTKPGSGLTTIAALNTLIPTAVLKFTGAKDFDKSLSKELAQVRAASRGEEGGDKAHRELLPRLGGFESLESTYQRIAVASIRATSGIKSPEERQTEIQEEILKTTQAIAGQPGTPKIK